MSKAWSDLAPSNPASVPAELRDLAWRVGFVVVIAMMAGFAARLLVGAPVF